LVSAKVCTAAVLPQLVKPEPEVSPKLSEPVLTPTEAERPVPVIATAPGFGAQSTSFPPVLSVRFPM